MEVEIVSRARGQAGRLAVDEGPGGARVTYSELVQSAESMAAHLLGAALKARDPGVVVGSGGDLDGARVAYLVPSGARCFATLWGIWLAGGIAVPLALSHPEPELAHVIADSGSRLVVATREMAGRVAGLAERLLVIDDLPEGARAPLPSVAPDRQALIVYTSGSTGRPKGAVWTHEALAHQVRTLVSAWQWESEDVALLVLPLHHVHGLVNVVTCGLWAGATIRVMNEVDPRAVWDTLADVTVLMAVPTIYHKLITAYDAGDPAWQASVARAARQLRLMISGSAALPINVLQRWQEITGHVLLERYGMTEIGMALSNPYEGQRLAGTVGRPLPGVDVRVVDESLADVPEGESGQLLVRGPGMFSEYWGRPDATAEAFRDGWFMTGDVVLVQDGVFRIRGRQSVDIIKTGGYKVSALEIEEVLRTHPWVADCAVVGLPDEEWGEVVGAAVVPAADGAFADAADRDQFDGWMRSQLAPYKLPRRVVTAAELPRNALGKVVKPRVRAELFEGAEPLARGV